MKVSILIPVFNEEESLGPLYEELVAVIDGQPWEAEMIFVDDGSLDGSLPILRELEGRDSRVRAIAFARNFGQTAAMLAAMDHAEGDVLIPMDADLQNDPADIPRLLEKLDEGHDVVSGWRKERRDKYITRRVPSMVANRIISRWTGVRLHDYGCTLKAYRRTVLAGTQLYGEMHRFVPIYAKWRGARVTEIVVNHRARKYGESKYGLNRIFKVLLDLLTIKFLGSFLTKPAYLFGGLGAVLMTVSGLAFGGVLLEKMIWDVWQHKMSVLIMATFLAMVAIILFMMGLLAELMVRVYHSAQGQKTYVLAKEVWPDGKPGPQGRTWPTANVQATPVTAATPTTAVTPLKETDVVDATDTGAGAGDEDAVVADDAKAAEDP